jgi:hypothetical protein
MSRAEPTLWLVTLPSRADSFSTSTQGHQLYEIWVFEGLARTIAISKEILIGSHSPPSR